MAQEQIWSSILGQHKMAPQGHPTWIIVIFLWGYLKERVYNPMSKTLEDLKENITREMKKIPKEILKSSFLNFVKRCNLVLSAEGIEYWIEIHVFYIH